jgi:hypothetical protein
MPAVPASLPNRPTCGRGLMVDLRDSCSSAGSHRPHELPVYGADSDLAIALGRDDQGYLSKIVLSQTPGYSTWLLKAVTGPFVQQALLPTSTRSKFCSERARSTRP